MPRFDYVAVASDGAERRGSIECAGRGEALGQLHADDLVPLSLVEHGEGLAALLSRPLGGSARPSRAEIIAFTRDLAGLTGAGLTLERALAILASGRRDRVASPLLTAIRGGAPLSRALAALPDSFPGYYVGLVRAGEGSGNLAAQIATLARTLQQQQAFIGDLRTALIYPALLALTVVATLILMVSVVLPQFETVFANAGGRLPVATRATMAIGIALRDAGPVLLAIALASLPLAFAALRDERRRRNLDARLLRLPLLGGFLAGRDAALVARTLAALLGGGVALVPALEIAAGAARNCHLRANIGESALAVRHGASLVEAWSEIAALPVLVLQLAEVGEETGALPRTLDEAADLLQQELETRSKSLVAWAAPGLTLAAGAIVAALVGSVLVGLLSVNELGG